MIIKIFASNNYDYMKFIIAKNKIIAYNHSEFSEF